MSTPADDDHRGLVLGFLFALILLVVLGVVGLAVFRYSASHVAKTPVVAGVPGAVGTAPASGAAPAAAVAPAIAVVTETQTVVIPEGASIRVADGVVNFYFATGSADIAPGAAEALGLVIQGVQAGRKAVVSGYHDTTGDAATNEALAKKRAETVRDVLVGLGVPADKVTLEKPAVSTTGTGTNAQARRVEVKLVD